MIFTAKVKVLTLIKFHITRLKKNMSQVHKIYIKFRYMSYFHAAIFINTIRLFLMLSDIIRCLDR